MRKKTHLKEKRQKTCQNIECDWSNTIAYAYSGCKYVKIAIIMIFSYKYRKNEWTQSSWRVFAYVLFQLCCFFSVLFVAFFSYMCEKKYKWQFEMKLLTLLCVNNLYTNAQKTAINNIFDCENCKYEEDKSSKKFNH